MQFEHVVCIRSCVIVSVEQAVVFGDTAVGGLQIKADHDVAPVPYLAVMSRFQSATAEKSNAAASVLLMVSIGSL